MPAHRRDPQHTMAREEAVPVDINGIYVKKYGGSDAKMV
jgi:hypothetical protein